VMYTTDKAMSQPCEMLVYDLRDEGQMRKSPYVVRFSCECFELLLGCQERHLACKKFC